MTYLYSGTKSSKIQTHQAAIQTTLQSLLLNYLGVSTMQHSLFNFAGELGLKEKKIESTSKITKKPKKKCL